MYDRILVAIDAAPDSPDDSLRRTARFAKMTGGTVYLLHVARGHIIPEDITAGRGSASGPLRTTSMSGNGRSSRTPSTTSPPRGSPSTARW